MCFYYSALHQQKLRQRSGDCLPGYTHRPVEDQPVCTRRPSLKSVSPAAQHLPNHYLQHEAEAVIVLDESNPLLLVLKSSEIS